jgi:hypothetical protein
MATVVESRSPLGAGLVLAPVRTEQSRYALEWRTKSAPGPAMPSRALAALAPGSPLVEALEFYAALATGAPAVTRQSAGPRLAIEMELTPLAVAAEAA